MDELAIELANKMNAVIMGVTWALIEVMTPLVEWLVKKPALKQRRVMLYEMQKYGKRIAAALWCSIIVWIPGAQPPLCGEGIEGDCQIVFHRVAIAIILGAVLSTGHWAGATLLRRLMGKEKPDKKAELTERT